MAITVSDVTAHLRGSALAGAVGAAGFGAVFVILAVASLFLPGGDPAGFFMMLVLAVGVLLTAAVLYFLGVLILGAPVRWLLGRVGLTGFATTAAIGAVISAGVSSAFFLRPPFTGEDALMLAGVALGGGLAAVVYRRHGEPHVVD